MNNPLNLEQIRNPLLRLVVQKISKMDVLEMWYDEWLLGKKMPSPNFSSDDTAAFMQFSLAKLKTHYKIINQSLLDSIPATGPLMFVANHPLGGLEGLILTHALREKRPDLKVLTNDLLRMIPEYQDIFIGVDVLNAGKQRENMKGIRSVTQHLSNDGALLVFPAGTVSRIKLWSFSIADAPWSLMVTRLAKKYKAPIMPIYVEGKNKLYFYLSGLIHKRLRTLLLPRAMIEKAGENISFHVGDLIHAKDIERLKNDEVATSYIRLCCEVLKTQNTDLNSGEKVYMETLEKDIHDDIVSEHISTLEKYLIHVEDSFSVYCAPYESLGPIKNQLAIERERTFRLVDEGTGKSLDNDFFDAHYRHLFLWDSKNKKIAGGYRVGITNEIIKSMGLKGLYSHSLFNYNQKFIEQMGNTIELGRSFVTKDYQRNPKALDMLWKGIGRFVALNPENHTLFGCVSISRQYSPLGSALLTETFLSHYGVDPKIQRKVKARTPIDNPKMPWTQEQIKNLSAIPVLNKLVGRIDVNKSIPILIRHYLSLGGGFVSFTVNEGFNQSLDGLITVDLRQTKDKYLKRYMGEEKLKEFRIRWKENKNVA